MSSTAPGLHNGFTEEGFWWLKGHEENQVRGTLSYDPQRGTELKLLGRTRDLETSFNEMFGGIRTASETIYGITSRGRPVTLLEAFCSNRQINTSGIDSEIWKSNLLLIGIQITSAKDDLFSKSYIAFHGIESWLEHRPFAEVTSNGSKTITINAEKPREVPFATHADFEVLLGECLSKRCDKSTRYMIDVNSHMILTSPEPRSLTWHIERAVRLQELASLCTGHYLPLTSLKLHGPMVSLGGSNTSPTEVHVYARMIHSEFDNRPRHETPVVTGPELIRFNPNAVQLWFDHYDVLNPAIQLFFTICGERKMFTNIRLLLAIQALEVFHRCTSMETVMPPEEFKGFAEALVNAIPTHTGPRMREKLNSLYRYANEPSLGQRLKAIITDVRSEFGTTPAGFDKSSRRKLVDTRHYYTHFSPELRDRILDGAGMYWASRRVILLLTVLFLQRLGVSAGNILPSLQRHREFKQLWESAEYPH